MIRKANAVWRGGLKDGKGQVSTGSGVLKDVPYNFSQRFEDAPGTNPEELIGAAHAGCYAMALSGVLGGAGLTAESLDVKASVTVEKEGAGFSVTKSHLELRAKIPNATAEAFAAAAEDAKKNCPISRLLKAEITLDAQLV